MGCHTSEMRDVRDKRVTLTGVFEKMHRHPHERYKVALLQDCEIKTPDGQTIDVGHTWIQQADTFEGFDIQRYERLSCLVRVREYTDEAGNIKYGFMCPTDIRLHRPQALRIPMARVDVKPVLVPAVQAQPEPTAQPDRREPALSIVEAVRKVKMLGQEMGGLDRLIEVAQELKEG